MTGRTFFRSRSWRVLRWAGLAAAVPALWACNARSLEAPTVTPNSTFQNNFQETVNRQIDLLFMIDDSSSMETAQANLKANMGSFMSVLEGLQGGLPDLHIAVVTSDMGAGNGSGDIGGCGSDTANPAGDGGIFKAAPTGGCTATGLDPGAMFLSDTGGTTPMTNFGTQDIATVFECITTVGANGCGFEHQLASTVHALGADNIQNVGGVPTPVPPQENANFLRPDAYLGIVLLTNEDDCSAPPGSALFNPASTSLNSTYGPTANFQCNEFGHLCSLNGGPMMAPSRLAPNNAVTDMVTYSPAGGPDNCVSAEGAGLLTPVGMNGFADQIKGLKSDPTNQILVAALTGPTTAYTVTWQQAPVMDTGPWPVIAHSCGSMTAATSFADPGVRMQQFVKEFGANGLVDTFCQANYGPSLNTIATKLSQLIGPKCIVGTVATRANSTTPDCSVTELAPNATDPSHPIQTPIMACADTNGGTPCWSLVAPMAGQMCNGQVVNLDYGTAMPANNTKSAVNCSLCTTGYPDPVHNCP